MTADYDPLALPAAYFDGLPTGVPSGLPGQSEPALIHADNGISDFALCGARLVWWEGPQPPPEHYPACTSRAEFVTCSACLSVVNASAASGAH